jgi:hypothetical protein
MNNQQIRQKSSICLSIIVALSVLAFTGLSPVSANNGNGNGNWNGNNYQNNSGYHHNGHYYPYAYHNNHRGYWQQNNGVRIFINI